MGGSPIAQALQGQPESRNVLDLTDPKAAQADANAQYQQLQELWTKFEATKEAFDKTTDPKMKEFLRGRLLDIMEIFEREGIGHSRPLDREQLPGGTRAVPKRYLSPELKPGGTPDAGVPPGDLFGAAPPQPQQAPRAPWDDLFGGQR